MNFGPATALFTDIFSLANSRSLQHLGCWNRLKEFAKVSCIIIVPTCFAIINNEIVIPANQYEKHNYTSSDITRIYLIKCQYCICIL